MKIFFKRAPKKISSLLFSLPRLRCLSSSNFEMFLVCLQFVLIFCLNCIEIAMFSMVFLLAILLLASGEHRRFFCNSPEAVRKMDIKQVIHVDNYTFLLNGNQLISFKPPFCFFNHQKRIVCAFAQAFQMKSDFKSRETDNFKLKGWIFLVLNL